MEFNNWINSQLSFDIWTKKYRHNNETFDDWLNRISNNNTELKQKIIEKKFLFGGRTLANRGLNRGSLSNCYCSGRVPDTLSDILDINKEIALTYKAQGGQGLSLTDIRPIGSKIHNEYVSDGIMPFMELFNTTTASVSQGGHRRGALMMSLSIEHPQAEEFINAKLNKNKLNNANLSVEIPDRFMEYVKLYFEGKVDENVSYQIPHWFKNYTSDTITIYPIKLYKTLMTRAWESAEPGVMFMNRFSNYNLMEFIDDYVIHTSNPCGK